MRIRHPWGRSTLLSLATIVIIGALFSTVRATEARAYVYWSNYSGDSIGRANLDGTGLNTTFIGGVNSGAGIAVDDSHIYWSSSSGDSIGRARLDGTDVNDTFITGVSNVAGVAVDDSYIYWTNGTTIGRANLDGTAVNTNYIAPGVGSLIAIAADDSYIYWTNGYSEIGRADAAGTNVSDDFVDFTGDSPSRIDGLALGDSSLYFTSMDICGGCGGGYILRADSHGTINELVKHITSGRAAIAVQAVQAEYAYWTDGAIERADLGGTSAGSTIISGVDPVGIAVDRLVAPPPAVTTLDAQSVTDTGATLSGTLNPEGVESTYHFIWGTSPSYGSSTISVNVGDGTSDVPASAVLTGLTPGTTYHYRVAASSVGGTAAGGDRTFTTLGSTAPSVATGDAPTDWGTASATLTGVINPHRKPASYKFYYGPASVQVSAFGDLEQYSNSTTMGGPAEGTSDVDVSAQIHNLKQGTPYYYRLVASNDDGTSWGQEHSFELTSPLPQNVAAPYLQVDGFDASSGYNVKCVPGSWIYTNGSYDIQWGYAQGHGAYTRAPGSTSTIDRRNDEYHVSSRDIGKALECLVTPHRLDGSLPVPLYTYPSNVLLPEGSKTLKAVIPGWLKSVWEGLDTAETLQSWGDAALTCVEVSDVPVFGEALCVAELFSAFAGNPFEEMLKEAVDPPDRAYRQIALPLPAPRHSVNSCRSSNRSRPSECTKLTRLANVYIRASGRLGSLLEVFAISRNRTLIARVKHDTETEFIQAAARKTYAGLLAATVAAQHKAGVAFAKGLRRAHIDVRVPARTLRRAARLSLKKIVGRRLLARLLAHGYRRSEIHRALSRLGGHVGRFDLRHFLRSRALRIPFARFYHTIDFNDLVALVSGLERQHALRGGVGVQQQLLADINIARAACTQRSRTIAVSKLLRNAKPNLKAGFYSFLREAAKPALTGKSTTDTYPPCLASAAKFEGLSP